MSSRDADIWYLAPDFGSISPQGCDYDKVLRNAPVGLQMTRVGHSAEPEENTTQDSPHFPCYATNLPI